MFRLRFAAIVIALAAAAVLPARAQEQTVSGQLAASVAAPPVTSQSALQSLELFSTSAASSDATNNASGHEDAAGGPGSFEFGKHIGPNPVADPQYGGGYGGPPRRRPYGRPSYNDRWTNPDGSTKFAFEAGVGPTSPAGAWGHYRKTGWDVSFGAGRNFNRAFGVLLQYDYSRVGVVNSILNAYYNEYGLSGGSTHIWSLTLNPVISFSDPHSHFGAYAVFGGGFYRKMTVYTFPQEEDIYRNVYSTICTECRVSNNAGGLNGGLGFTYKFTDYSNVKLFAEARYTWIDNQPTAASNASIAPENNHRTGYFPVTMGVRF